MDNNDIWVVGHKIRPLTTTGNYDLVLGETPPKVPGPPPHYHTKMSEVFVVIEGEMEFLKDGVVSVLRKGDIVDLPAHSVHTFHNKGDVPCKWINIHSPKGFIEFFREMGVSDKESEAMQASVSESMIQKVMKEAVEYDMHIKV